MYTPARTLHLIQWTARITGTLLLAFLLFMLIGHLVGDANGPTGMRFSSEREIMAFVLFPVCTITGLSLAFKWEFLGGSVALASIVLLIVMRNDLFNATFIALSIPAMLYMVHGWIQMRDRKGERA